MTRLRYNGLSNSLGAALTSGGTTITFASKLTYAGGDVPTISGSDYIPLSILDADGNCAEVVHLTAYTSAATTGTIARGKEDTSGVAHDSGAVVVHGPTANEIPRVYYAEGTGSTDYTTTSTSFTDVDSSNLVVSVPAVTGDVIDYLSAFYTRNGGAGSAQARLVAQTSGTEIKQTVNDNTQDILPQIIAGRYTVASGDISGGVVEIRLQYRATSGTTEMFNNTDRHPFIKAYNTHDIY